MAEQPFITCHALDTTTGKPAAGISVSLTLISPLASKSEPTLSWSADTNNDGRVAAWSSNNTSAPPVNQVVSDLKSKLADNEQMVWKLTFDTESYFGKEKTFWPEVDLIFAAQKHEEHYHVPLLLGPWSYTTYRGS